MMWRESARRIRHAVLSQAREESGASKTRFTIPQLQASLPRLIAPQAAWKATASGNPDDAAGGFSLARWSSVSPQKPGMWRQVQLPPQLTTFTEIQFDSPRAGESGGGRAGGRGRGAAGPPAPLGVPLGYKVEISSDGSSWTQIAEGKSESDTTNITVKPTKAKFIRMTQTGEAPKAVAWNMEKFRLYGPPVVAMASAAKAAAQSAVKPAAPKTN
jgi:glucosylceramidase